MCKSALLCTPNARQGGGHPAHFSAAWHPLEAGRTHFLHNGLHSLEYFPSSSFTGEGGAAFIGSHAALVHAGVGCEFAHIEKVEIVEKGWDVVFEFYVDGLKYRHIVKSVFPGILDGFFYAGKEILFGIGDTISISAETIPSDPVPGLNAVQSVFTAFNDCFYFHLLI